MTGLANALDADASQAEAIKGRQDHSTSGEKIKICEVPTPQRNRDSPSRNVPDGPPSSSRNGSSPTTTGNELGSASNCAGGDARDAHHENGGLHTDLGVSSCAATMLDHDPCVDQDQATDSMAHPFDAKVKVETGPRPTDQTETHVLDQHDSDPVSTATASKSESTTPVTVTEEEEFRKAKHRDNKYVANTLMEGFAFHNDCMSFIEEEYGEGTLRSMLDSIQNDSMSTSFSGIEAPHTAACANRLALAEALQIPHEQVPMPRLLHMVEWESENQKELLLAAKQSGGACLFSEPLLI